MTSHGKRTLVGMLVALLLALGPVAAGERWLHVKVDEAGRDGEKVRVNVPLHLVETVLPLIDVDELHGGKLHLDIDELDGIDVRQVMAALRDTPDATFVTVQGKDESVRVAKENEFFIVRVEDRSGRSKENVRVTVPMAVVEALFSGGAGELDLIAALDALSEFDGEDLVSVQADDASVRVWIDSSETAD